MTEAKVLITDPPPEIIKNCTSVGSETVVPAPGFELVDPVSINCELFQGQIDHGTTLAIYFSIICDDNCSYHEFGLCIPFSLLLAIAHFNEPGPSG
jgi:hypothetical protein